MNSALKTRALFSASRSTRNPPQQKPSRLKKKKKSENLEEICFRLFWFLSLSSSLEPSSFSPSVSLSNWAKFFLQTSLRDVPTGATWLWLATCRHPVFTTGTARGPADIEFEKCFWFFLIAGLKVWFMGSWDTMKSHRTGNKCALWWDCFDCVWGHEFQSLSLWLMCNYFQTLLTTNYYDN